MGFGHDEAVVADDSGTCRAYASVDYAVFAYDVVVADFAVGFFAFPAEVLRVGSDYAALVYFVVFADGGTVHNAHIGHYFAIIAYLDIFVDEGKRMDVHIVADFS